MKINVILSLFIFSMLALHADDWTTTDGKTFHSVKVVSHDDAYVTIIDSDGGGRVPLRTLTPELQKQFGYDATKAAACEAATVQADRAERAIIAQTEHSVTSAKSAAPASRPTQNPQVLAPAPLAPSSAPASNVNIAANEAVIREDKEKLESFGVKEPGPGSISDAFGEKPADASPDTLKLLAAFKAEITQLENEDAAAATIEIADNTAKITQYQHELDDAKIVLRGAEGATVSELQEKIDHLKEEISGLRKQNDDASRLIERVRVRDSAQN